MRFIAAVACLLVAMGQAASADSITFVDPTKTFSVMLPFSPTVTAGDGFAQYLADRGSATLLVTDTDFSGKNIDPSKVLDDTVQRLAASGYAVWSRQPVSMDNHDGTYVAGTDRRGYHFESFMFFFDNHLYQFSIGTTNMNHGLSYKLWESVLHSEIKLFRTSIHFLR